MADYRPFGATNEEDTCLWCGRKLKYKAVESHPEKEKVRISKQSPFYDAYWKENGGEEVQYRYRTKYVADRLAEKSGDYADGFFCGLRCAYQFAVRMAQLGRRFNSRDGKQQGEGYA